MRAYCEACDEMVRVRMVDEGIGDYEYWGCCEKHVDMQPVCAQCENPLEMPVGASSEADDPND